MTLEGELRRPLLELEGITKTFDSGTVGVRDVDLIVREGDFLAIMGPSGAGKSTLLNVLGLLDRADSGKYLINGAEVSSLREVERDRLRGQTFGFVFQSAFVLGDDDVITNAALSLRTRGASLRDRRSAATSALARVHLTHRSRASARLLSGGERQRLAIARAISGRPLVLLADEPTGNLDSANGTAVLELLHALNREGVTIVLITHDERIAEAASRQITIVDGVLTEQPMAAANPGSTGEAGQPPRTQLDAPTQTRTPWRRTMADEFGDALRGTTQRLMRTLLLLTAFALGVGGLIGSLGASESAAAQVSQRLTAAALDEVRVVLPTGTAEGSLAEASELAARAAALPHVESVGVQVAVGGQSAGVSRLGPTDSTISGVSVVAASAALLEVAEAHVSPATGHLLGTAPGVALVGARAAEALDIATPGPGSTLWVNGRVVDIVGIIETSERIDLANTVVVSADVVTGLTESTSIIVRTEQGYPAAIADALPTALDPSNPGRFSIETVADLRALRFGVSNDLGIFIAIVGAIILLLAMLGAGTTMYLSVQARTAEIALRRALGAGRGAIARLFIGEGAIVGLVGGSIGGVLGVAGVLAISALSAWTPVLPAGLTPVAVGLGLLAGATSAMIPAVLASRKDPALAIRGAG